MDCKNCKTQPVIILQHGAFCKSHFLRYFEQKVFSTINKFRLIDRNDKLCAAASGGKDSLTVLYLTKKYIKSNRFPNSGLFAIAIDEGIKNYRKKTLGDLKKFCKKHKVPLHIYSFKDELGSTLDKISKKDIKKNTCNICGVWRRYLLNRKARELGATKIVTGHNLDDEAQVTLMNIFKANTKLAGRLGPLSGIESHKLFVQRVKPLYLCSEKEVRLYSLLKKFDIGFTECPYAEGGYRYHIQEMLNGFENRYKGTKQGIINSFLEILPILQEKHKGLNEKIRLCGRCREPANQNTCNACKIKEEVKNA